MYIKIILLGLAIFCTNNIYAQVKCNQGNQDPNNNPNQETIDSDPSAKSEATAVQPVDPNEIVGTDGWMVVDAWGDTVRWVSASQSLPYTVYFENDPLMATAAAQVVTVRLRLHPLMNIADFRIGTFAFGNRVFPVEGSPLQYQTRLDLVEEMNLYVDVVAGIDITRNEAFWIFSSIDPITGIAPTESNRGFLAINDSTHIGEGFVTFSIKPSANRCHTGDTIGMQASIIFDVNEAIETNRWVNTIDAEAPVSNCTVIANEMPAYQDSIYLTFSGEDDATGMAAYRLYYTENGSAFRLAGRYLAGDTAVFASQPNTTYSFFSLGEDMVSNIEPMKGEADTLFGNTRVQLLASVRPEGAGIITGTSSYILGDTANLFVQPTVGYRLLRWSEGGVPQGTDTLLTLVADQNHNLTAEMARLSYPLTVEAAEGTNITVTTRTPTGNQPSYQEVRHFDTLDIHISASPCYDNVSFYLNGFPLTSDTMLVVHETVSLSSAATQQIDTGYVYDTVCRNFSYSANGYNILSSATNTSGIAIFQRSVINSSGCDSVSQLILYVKPFHTLTFVANGGEGTMPTQQICDGEESVLNSSNFTREGYFFAGWAISAGATTAQYADGGIITLTGNQTLYAVWSSNCVNRECNNVVTVCDSYMWNGELKTESGDYLRTVSSAVPGGCDSIYRLRLTVKHSSENLQQVVSCHPFTWIDGLTYYSDTTRQLSMANTVGCDSLITLQLVVTDNIYATESVTACNSYLWHGEEYTASTNSPTFTTQNADGCDSVVTLHLTINHCSTTEITACDSYTWHGSTFSTSGVYADGTDTLNLTINYSTTGIDALTACDSITWHGNLYTNGGNGIATYTTTNALGCDSVVTLNLTLNHSTAGIETVTACNSYLWHGEEYTASTNSPTFTAQNADGCDSVVTLHLTINHCSTTEITACDSYTWHGATFTTSGVYADGTDTLDLTINYSTTGIDVQTACDSISWHGNLYNNGGDGIATYTTTNAVGCDSVATLNLTLNHSSAGIETVTACNSYLWHGEEYTASTNSPTFTTQNADGCDSVVTLHLTINHCSTTEITACDSYTWHGATFTTSGVYADGTDTLDLTINHSTTGIDVQTACDSFVWHGNLYINGGNGTATYMTTNAAGCDSVATLNLTLNHSTAGIEIVTACNSYLWHGEEYTASTNSPTFTTQNADGCDSVVTLHLTINHCSTTEITACDSYTWHGATFTTSGVYTDGTDTLDLTINYSTTGIDVQTACDSITWHGTEYTTDNNTATYTTTNAAGCDSVVTLNLTINNCSTTNIVACDSYTWHGTTYTTSGIYTIGTDTLVLTVNNNSTSVETITSCDSYTWHGNTYTSSNNTATFTTTNAAGCDSVVTLNLTVNYSNTGVETITACNNYVWHGIEYTASTNNPTFTTLNAAGCDSVTTLNLVIQHCSTTEIITCDSYTWHGTTYTTSGTYSDGNDTLNLTVNYSTAGIENVTACDNYTWHGATYTSSNNTATYTTINASGCDSVVTLNLTVNYSNTGVETVTACNSYVWHGTEYTANNNSATYTTTNAAGCDSAVTLNLTVNYSTTSVETVTACDSYNWHGITYTADNNTATFTTTNAVGCDSVVTLNLTVNYSTTSIETVTACDSYSWHGTEYTTSNNTATYTTTNAAGCDSTVTLNLTVNYSVSTFDTLTISNDLLPYEYNGITINGTGDYTLVLSTLEGCDSTIMLYVRVTTTGIDDLSSTNDISIYPNPTNGMVTIVADKVLHVDVLDIVGRKVSAYDDTLTIDLSNLPDGSYILRITTPHGTAVRKVTKK